MIFEQLSLFSPTITQQIAKIQDFPYLSIDGDIPLDIPSDAFIALNRNIPLKIYSLGFQPAKSIPEIPRWFLHKYGNKSWTILEPFAGSGTTILESFLYEASIYWLDYHPLSRLICQVKTSQFDLKKTIEQATKFLNKAKNQTHAPETVKFKNKDFWFQKPVQEALEILKVCIQESERQIQSLLWLVFSLTVRKVSDMNDGMILAAKRSHVEKIPQRSRQDVYRYFQHYLKKTIEALIEWQEVTKNIKGVSHELLDKTAKKIQSKWSVNAVITSPPYINAIDYVWASKFELHWLGMINSDQERLDLYSQEIGTERLSKQECKELGRTGYKYLDQLIEDVYTGKNYQASKGQNQLRARVIYQYFMDMKEHFKTCFDHLTNKGYYCFAIGDVSKICGVDIPVASLLTDLASEIGYKKIFQFHLLLKNRRLNLPRNVNWASVIKHDTIVVLEKI